MEHIIELLKSHNLSEIGVTLQYLPDCIQNYFGDGSEWGVSLRYYVEEVPLGTAGSVKNAEEFLDDTFLVISGDGLTDIDLSAAIQFHREKQAAATLVLMEVDSPLEYGVVITDQQGRITKFLEKPSWGEVFSNKVNTGIYILEPQVLSFFEPGQIFDFSKDLFPQLLADGLPLFGYVAQGYWCDIGNLEQYQQSHFDVLAGRTRVKMPGIAPGPEQREQGEKGKQGQGQVQRPGEGDAQGQGEGDGQGEAHGQEYGRGQVQRQGVWIGQNTQIDPSAKIKERVVIGDNCYIGPGVQIGSDCIIGDNVVIEEQASLKRSVILENCHIGKKAQIRGAILANQVQAQSNVSIFEGAVVGDACILGPHSRIKPNTKVWPFKRIEAGTLVNASLIWGSCSPRTLFGNQGITGEANVEITPGFAVKLGSAYGTWLGPGAAVGIGTDDSAMARVIKHAFVAGILGTGVQVKDLGTVAAPINRFNTRRLGLKGSVQIQMPPRGEARVTLVFYDSRGVEISRLDEKKIENMLAMENFRQAEAYLVGQAKRITDAVPTYLAALTERVNVADIRQAHFRLIIAFQDPALAALVQPFLNELGCETIIAAKEKLGGEKDGEDGEDKIAGPEVKLQGQAAALQGGRPQGQAIALQVRPQGHPQDQVAALQGSLAATQDSDRTGYYEQLSQMVLAEEADLGIVFDANLERLVLISDRGQVINEELYTVLLSLLLFRLQPGKTVAVPVTAPSVIEWMAEQLQGKVIRTKSSTQSFMDQLFNAQSGLNMATDKSATNIGLNIATDNSANDVSLNPAMDNPTKDVELNPAMGKSAKYIGLNAAEESSLNRATQSSAGQINSESKINPAGVSQFLLFADGLLALTQLLAHLGEAEITLSELLAEIPDYYLSKQIINCPWEAKGKVIRTLIEEKQQEPESLELLEGVKIHHPQGWVLVVPDGEQAVCRVYGEGFSQEIAESLTDWYSDRIREIGQMGVRVNGS